MKTAKCVSFSHKGTMRYSVVAGAGVVDVTSPEWPTLREVIAADPPTRISATGL